MAGLSVSSVSVTFAVAVAVAVDVQAIQCFVDDDVLALLLDSNLHEEVNEEAAAAQLLKVTENVQVTQPKEKKVTGTTPTPKLQPDCIIEVEASPEANEGGHVVIAIENPNPDLDVVLVVRMRRKLKLWYQHRNGRNKSGEDDTKSHGYSEARP